MRSKKKKDVYIVKLERGEMIVESLLEFCKKNKINCGFFSGIGAVDQAELAHYIVETKKYSTKVLSQPLEIISLSGNISKLNKQPYIHCHICLGDEKMKAIAGHLKEAKVSATCEIFLYEVRYNLKRKYDEQIGLNLLDI